MFKILALDFHNTIYDEVMEYGLAIDAAISHLLAADKNVSRETLYKEISEHHKKYGSDWDEDGWEELPSLKDLPANVIEQALKLRREKSRELTISGAFKGAVKTLKTLKKRSVRIYMITEAAADAGTQGLQWLGLGGVIDGVYTYPSRKAPVELAGTFHKPFPEGHKKPHPALLKQVAIDAGVGLDKILYVGDSKYKDGMMARDAGVKFGYAAYGKKVTDKANFEKSREIMYAVTGWDKEALKLTQEAGRSPEVEALVPDYVFKDSLAEVLELF